MGTAARVWLGVCVVAACAAFSSGLRAPYEYDDMPAIRLNTSIAHPISALFPPSNTSVAGRPVVNLTLALNRTIDGALGVDPAGPNATLGLHIGNLLIHLACGFLLFAVVARTVRRVNPGLDATTVAGLTTLLWLVHPIQTESVHYLIQRTELLVSAFYLATLYAAIRAWEADEPGRRRWLIAGIVLCALGMGSKEVMATAPVIVLLYDRAFVSNSWRAVVGDRARRWFYGGLFASMLFVAATIALGVRDLSVGFGLGMTPLEYARTQCWAIARYLRLILWPDNLNIDYGDRVVSGAVWIPGAILIAGAVAASVAAWRRTQTRSLGFLGAWFFLIIAPSSSFVPIRTEIAAERRVYLASAAVVLLAVVGIELARRRFRLGAAARTPAAIAAAVLALVTYERGIVYQSSETLYRDVIAKAPDNPRGYLGVGLALFSRSPERSVEVEALFRKAIAVDTSNFLAWQSLGVLQLTQRRWQDAVDVFTHALRISPDNLDAISGIARAHIELLDANAAMPFVDKLGQRNEPALWAMGNLLVRKGRGAEAIRYLELAAAIGKPPAVGVALLSLAYAQSNAVTEAERAARVALANAGDTADVYDLAARAMLKAKKPLEARAILNHALTLEPNSESLRQARRMLDSLQQRGPYE